MSFTRGGAAPAKAATQLSVMKIYPLKIVEHGTNTPGAAGRCSFLMEDDARESMGAVLGRFGLTPDDFLAQRSLACRRDGLRPWGLVMFPGEYPLAGYLAQRRQRKINMPIYSYSRLSANEPAYDGIHAPLLAAFDIRAKIILEILSADSPLLAPIWEGMKDLSSRRQWLCLADPPPAGLVVEQQAENDRLMALSYSRSEKPFWWRKEETIGDDVLRTAYRLAREHCEAELWDRARDALRQVVAIRPDMPEAWFFMGLACGRLDDDMEGVGEAMQRVCELEPWQVQPRLYWMFACLHESHYIRAFDLLQDGLGRDLFNEKFLCWYMWVSLELEQYHEIIKFGRILLEIDPASPQVCYHMGLALYHTGWLEEALVMFEEHTRLHPDHYLGWNNSALILARLGRLDDALDAICLALAIEVEDPFAWDTHGYIHMLRGHHAEAEESLLKAIELRHDHADAWRHLVHNYHRAGKSDKLSGALAYLESFSPADAATVSREIADPAMAIS